MEAVNITLIFVVFGLTQPGIEQSESAISATDAVFTRSQIVFENFIMCVYTQKFSIFQIVITSYDYRVSFLTLNIRDFTL